MEFIPLIIVMIAISAVYIAVKDIKADYVFERDQELAIALDQSAEQAKKIIELMASLDYTTKEYQRMKDQRNDAESENDRIQGLMFEQGSNTYDVHFYGIEPIRVKAMTVSTAIIIAKTQTDASRPYQHVVQVV